MGLFYLKESKAELIGYADAGYLSDPHKGRSQTGCIFTYGETAISWRSTKQTLAATSSNYAELLSLHEASRECVWLRSLSSIFENHAVFQLVKIVQLSYMKTMKLVSHRLKKATSKEIGQNTLILSFSLLMSFNKEERLMFVEFVRVRILQIY